MTSPISEGESRSNDPMDGGGGATQDAKAERSSPGGHPTSDGAYPSSVSHLTSGNKFSPEAKIYIAGHRGMVGSAIVRLLQSRGCENLLLRSSAELDLRDQTAVRTFMQTEKPDVVIVAAARVGGIHANSTYPADFIYDNLMIECNLIHEAYKIGVQKLLFLGSSCIYPRMAAQPMREDALLTGTLEPTNEPYAVAKIAGIKLCESYNRQYGVDYRSVMPTNLYGPGDNFHPENSHVVPALIRRFHLAKLAQDGDLDALNIIDQQSPIPEEVLSDLGLLRNAEGAISPLPSDISRSPTVKMWGTGTPFREFLHVDDMAAASLFVLDLPVDAYEANTEAMISHINVGSGQEVSIGDLAKLIAEVVGFTGTISFDTTKPDGAPRKLMDSSRLADMGWQASISLKDGLSDAYRWFLEAEGQVRR
ncbi:MAG: GDP-L-fucose synthase [Mariprofundus sp.]|nr:GDP-L-fucose synthase [Mariprofundus sp.]